MPKGFSKGKISLEFKGGQGTNSSLNSAIGKTRSEIDELLFEYGISNSIGIGFTIHHQKYIHKSETLETNKNNSIIENLYAISLLSSSHNSLYNYILLSSLNNAINQKNTLIFHSTSLDLSGSYHFLTGNTFDPFVRGYLGLGTLGGDGFGGPISYIHLGFGGGIRYYFTSMWFAIAEINTNIYNIVDGGFHEFNEAWANWCGIEFLKIHCINFNYYNLGEKYTLIVFAST
ncbi:MAG: hypothetical protein IPH52_27675 [Leptospiraceae bacterium]|nr:hypothetical protein [Leptospiraceae bacterium]